MRNPSKSSKILLPQKKKEKEKYLIFRMMTEVLWSSAGTSFTTQFLKILETPAFKNTCLHNVIICVCKRKKMSSRTSKALFFPIVIHLFDYSKKKKKTGSSWGPCLGLRMSLLRPCVRSTNPLGREKISKLHF